ncbi:hypothetical protein E3N88_01439 [Mikania micrantha]|uniref:Protein kinase domain-containing protein n=1 Tax=Mikania micrantha TaxID=192012 RepID=A0A5N6Q1L5_9ASTR|nr:hypothetical protein E3N88_01439 [Mikania micrantha]
MKLFMYLTILFSLTATSPVVADYAKKGCSDTCGNNVTIPFPFGINANCAINEWYIVECNNSTPYLPAVVNRPEVLGVNLEDQTITVSTPRITAGCQNPVGNISQNMSMNLGGSPFFFSKSHNKFVFEGCGAAAIMMDDESVVTGNATFIPVSLLWTLRDSDQITCCSDRNPYRRIVVNQWYLIDCNSSTPFLPTLNHLKVLGVDLKNQTVTVSTPRITDCHIPIQNSSKIMGFDLGGSPFFFSKYNRFVFKGCGNVFMMMDNGSVLTACSTACLESVTNEVNNIDKCFGMGDCCETTIPYYFNSYSINLSLNGSLEEEGGGCGSGFLVDETSYNQGSWNTTSFNIPVSLRWTLTYSDQFACCDKYPPQRNWLDMLNGTTLTTRECFVSSSSLEGNYYLRDGCKYKDDNDIDSTEECRRCKDRGGYCTIRDWEYDVDGLLFSEKFYCYKGTSLGVILGVSISTGVLFLVGFSYFLYKWIKKTKEKRQRKRFFKRNGGLLLKQQEEADPSLVDKTIHFTSRELQKATDNFNENRILGRGGQGTVYKGMLTDGRIVAVKKSKIVDESQLEHFINEVVILSQINHRNVVKLLGCCLETEVPVLVSEFIPNGTLYDRLHNETDEFPISLDMRLQIATEGTRDELMIAANLAMRCLNMNGKYRPTMKEVAIELENIRRSHVPSKVQMDTGHVVYGEELSMLNYGESSTTFLSFNESNSQ